MPSLSVQAGGVLAAQVTLAVVLVPAGVRKLRDPAGFARGVREYDLLRGHAVTAVARTLPLVEVLLGAALLSGVAPLLSGVAASLLMLVFISVLAITLRRGRAVDCNCYGVAATGTVSAATITRNCVLLALSLAVLGGGLGARPGDWRSVSSAADGLLVALLAGAGILLVYLVEWSVEARRLARVATTAMGEAT